MRPPTQGLVPASATTLVNPPDPSATPGAKPAAGEAAKPSKHVIHQAQNVKKRRASLHVEIPQRQRLQIDALAGLTGYSLCHIITEILHRGLPGAKRHFQRQLEL